MLLLRFASLFSFVLSVPALAKPFGARNVAPRQDIQNAAESDTICGDLIIHANNGYSIFYADQVFECLSKVPFNAAVATRFVNYYNMTLQFQSTLALLRDPPAEYQQPPVDVLQVLSQIQSNITAGYYKSQYSFEAEVQLLVNRMHDSHVALDAGILDAFTFLSEYGLVSASPDGKEAPEVYLAEDLLASRLEGFKASPVTQINGRDVVQYLTEFAETNSEGYLEPHADWNSLMDSPALYISGDLSIMQSLTLYPGDELNFILKNGSTVSSYWLAVYTEADDTGPLTTAGDFYNYFVLGQLPASYDPDHPWWPTLPSGEPSSIISANSTTADSPYKAICSQGHPAAKNWCESSGGAYPNNPAVVQSDLAISGGGIVTGYFYDDISTGVLSIPSFYQYDPDIEQFDLTIQYFIGNATENNISRVIIDLQTNSGGDIYLAYNTFKQLFYSMDPYAASRIRNHALADILGNTYSKWWKDLEKDLGAQDGLNGILYNFTASNEWVAVNRINAATGGNFSSWPEYSGVSDHPFSAAQRYNLSDEVFDASAFNGWIPYGYGIAKDSNPIPQVWAPENMIILTDGLCGSACAIFVEFMTHQAGVRTVAVGGRPTPGPMQAVSGSRGARSYDARELDDDFTFVTETIQNKTAAALLPNRSDTGLWITGAGINIRDQVRSDNKPLQFKYEAADCRIYYSVDNIFNMTRLWHDAAAAAWDDTSLCVAGSTGFPSGRNTTSPSTQAPPPRTARVPSLSLDIPSNVGGGADNATDSGLVGSTDRHPQNIVACGSGCGTLRCLPTTLRCGGVNKPVKACLPTCSSLDKTCSGAAECRYDVENPQLSKLNERANRKATVKVRFQQGHCVPTGPTLELPCPR